MEEIVPETQRIQAMDAVVKETSTRWWKTHHTELQEWAQVVECIKVIFQPMMNFELMN